MRRVSLLLIVAGVALLVSAWLLGRPVGAGLMPSYLADWLFWSALPVGALPVVMLLDLAGPGAGFGLEPVLRRLLWLMPVAAVLMIPVLVWPGPLFGWASGHGFSTPFGHRWMGHEALVIRGIVYFAVWIVLALLFDRPPSLYAVERRRGIAAVGLFAYLRYRHAGVGGLGDDDGAGLVLGRVWIAVHRHTGNHRDQHCAAAGGAGVAAGGARGRGIVPAAGSRGVVVPAVHAVPGDLVGGQAIRHQLVYSSV